MRIGRRCETLTLLFALAFLFSALGGHGAAWAQMATPAYHTQDVAIVLQLRAQDETGAMQDVTDQLLTVAQASAGNAVALAGGYSFAPTSSLSATAIDAAGKPIPNVTVDAGLLSVVGADGNSYTALTLIASADISQGRANLRPDDLLSLDLSGLPAFAGGAPGDVSFALLQMLPPESYGSEAGMGRLDVFAARWNAGSDAMTGIAAADGSLQPAVMVDDPLTMGGTPAPPAGSAAYASVRQSGVTGGFSVKDPASKQSAPAAQPASGSVQPLSNLANAAGTFGLGPTLQRASAIVGGWLGSLQPPAKVFAFNSPCGPNATNAHGQGPKFCFTGKGDAHTKYHDTTGQVGQSNSTFSFTVAVDDSGTINGSGSFETSFALDIITFQQGLHCATPAGAPAKGQLIVSGSYTEPGDGASLGGFELKLAPTNVGVGAMQCSDGSAKTLPYDYWNAWNWKMPLQITRAVQGINYSTSVDFNSPSVDPTDYDVTDYPGTLELSLYPVSAGK